MFDSGNAKGIEETRNERYHRKRGKSATMEVAASKMMRMKAQRVGFLRCLGLSLFMFWVPFSVAACFQMDNDPHFHKIYDNDTVHVFTLELARLESTASICTQHPYFYVVTSESETTDTEIGHAGLSHSWTSGEARFVARPKQHSIRNDTATVHRAIIVEILTKLEFNPLDSNYQTDAFSGDLGSAKPTWTVSVEHGPMSAVKTQLGPADNLDVSGRTRILIALSDLSLNGLGKDIELSRQEVQVISPESDFTIHNRGRFPAKFITLAF